MLVNQAVCRIQPEPTLLRDPRNRRIALDWNVQKSIERQFAQARKAWVRYQSTRQRDAIYGYLSVVFEIVQRWAMLGHTRTCSLHALTAANRRGAIRTHQAIMHRSVYERFDAVEVLQYDLAQPYRPPTLSNHIDFMDAYQGGVRNPNPVAMAMYVEDRLNHCKSDKGAERA
jgi:hypothetical protein